MNGLLGDTMQRLVQQWQQAHALGQQGGGLLNGSQFGGQQNGGQMGLLGGQQGAFNGQQGQQTQGMMSQYLQNLFMRRYNPPAISGQGVTSQMGQGGMQYMAPQMHQQALPQTQQAPQQQPGYGPPGQDWGYM